MSDTATDFDYKSEVDRMMLVARVLAGLNLDGITSTNDRAHALAPFLDPTAYMQALDRGDMRDIERLAEALKPAQKIILEIAERHGIEL